MRMQHNNILFPSSEAELIPDLTGNQRPRRRKCKVEVTPDKHKLSLQAAQDLTQTTKVCTRM